MAEAEFLKVCTDEMDARIGSLARQFTAIPSRYGSIAAPSAISHHVIDFVCIVLTELEKMGENTRRHTMRHL